MQKNHILYSIILFLTSSQVYSQLCEGSLGDPVIEINFGSGTNRGPALGSNITAFTYSSSGNLDEGEYTIANTTSGLKDNAWHTTSDHTGDSNGYMMVINSAVLANEGVFYTKTVTGLCANTTFEFSAWLMNIMNPSAGTDEYHPDVTFRISDTSGNILGSYNTGDIAQSTSGIWQQYGFFFTLDADTEVVITILNSAPSAHPGNDIALDDIEFRPCGPTISNTIENETTNSITVCQNENVSYTFQTTISEGYSNPQYQWQYSTDLGTTWLDIENATALDYIFTETTSAGIVYYRIAAANGDNINSISCRITSEVIIVEITATPEPLIGEAEQQFCTTQNPTLSDIEVNANAVWYDAAINGNILPNTTSLVSGTIYYAKKESLSGCESDEILSVTVTIISPTLVVNNISTIICDTDNDNSEFTDLTIHEDDLVNCNDCIFSYFMSLTDAENYYEEGLILNPTNYEWTTDTYSIFVRIDSLDKCYQIAEISISLGESPIIPIEEVVSICEGENSVTIDAGYGFNSYLWSTGEISQTISVNNENIGQYWVSVTEDYGSYTCSSLKEFEVILSNTAIISNIEIEDWTDNNNSITIFLSDLSLGDYEYSIDNINYQDSDSFTGLSSGEYTVYVRDKNGCDTAEEVIYLLNYPKFFTPNGDGTNDNWYIKDALSEPSLTILIFNRYGKILANLDATSTWDGTYNGNLLPTNDYWFKVTRANGKTHVGHFTLKR
ncbi:T9SS type B sorting domain-containing protein [Winogradskyella litoriviva]|uniref:T9SS type B sorting domain-containing protein n=1 Tax=Winogradskyella litoriviva TaxID=1220182 RepID=A0ABX2E4G6_9FLAO|nr:T9SS type B sorting domain-containing protein [Winogradskyella litoriviva]NRD22866.1 T9SS type B sorting domain-containing protein [Winogradskyella litoriviva]